MLVCRIKNLDDILCQVLLLNGVHIIALVAVSYTHLDVYKRQIVIHKSSQIIHQLRMLLHAVENLGDHQLQPGNFLGDLHAGNPVVAGFDLPEVSSSGGDGLFRLLRKVFAAAEFFCLLSFSFFLLLALLQLFFSCLIPVSYTHLVCSQCGEVSYSHEVAKRLEEIVGQMKNIMTEVAIVHYKPTAA